MKSAANQLGTISTAVQLTSEQRQALADALQIDAKFVPKEIGVLGISKSAGPRAGIPVDRSGQFAPAMVMM